MSIKSRVLTLSVLAFFLSLVLVGTGNAQRYASTDPAHKYDRWAMVGNIMGNSMVMLQQEFVATTDILQAAAQDFQANPTLETLDALQAVWRETAFAWYRADVVGFEQSVLWRNQISKTPVNEEFVESFIADYDVIDVEFIGAAGSTSKGLPAIEYLIFDLNGDNQAVLESLTTGERADQRMQYMVACAESVHLVGREYLDTWVGRQDYYFNNPRNADQLQEITEMELRDLTNKLIDTIENVVSMKLGQPLGTTTGGNPRPDLVEFARSDFALNVMIAQLEGVRVIFNGITPEEDGIGFDDHIAFLESEFEGEPLEDVINAQIDAAQASLTALDGTLEELIFNDYDTLDEIYEQVRQLVRYIKADMTSELAIELVFSDNDGD